MSALAEGGGGRRDRLSRSRLAGGRRALGLQMFAVFIAAEAGDSASSLISRFFCTAARGLSPEPAAGSCVPRPSPSSASLTPTPPSSLQSSQNTRAHKKKNTSRFFISESKHLGHGGLEVMGKEEAIGLIRPHTLPLQIKQKSLLHGADRLTLALPERRIAGSWGGVGHPG